MTRKMFGAAAIAAALLTVLSAAPPARATVMVELALEDMIRDADAVVRGVVEHSAVRMDLRTGQLEPWTVTRVRASAWLKASARAPESAVVEIEEMGGAWNGGGSWIDGTPRYRVNEEVVVLLKRDDEGHLRTLGMVQGKFVVRRGVPGVLTVIVRDLSSVGFAHWVDGQMTIGQPHAAPSLTFDAFAALVRQLSSYAGAPR
jgi:hypothetical protein